MKLGKLAILVAILAAAVVSGWSSPGEAITLPGCDNFTCAFDGDFAVMSLPIAGVDVPSSPGKIKDGVVIYTGSGGQGVTTNLAGMDNAFPSVSGACPPNCGFSTTTTTDPGGTGQFAGDAQSWDSTLAAFVSFLNGSSPIFFFNQNDTNNAGSDNTCPQAVSAQDVCVYGLLTLVDLQNSANNVTFELEGPTTLFSGGPQPTDGIPTLPSEFVLAKGDVCLDAVGNQTPCDGSGNPVVVGPINHNLGADHAAYAGFSDVLNALLATCAAEGVNTTNCPWDSISIRLDLTDINNGFEQLFILTTEQLALIPAPATLILLGAGLLGLGASTWRRRQRG